MAAGAEAEAATDRRWSPGLSDPPGTVCLVPEVPPTLSLLETAVHAVGGAERPGQVEMAEAVDHSIRTGEHLAVQAGTGTGKSLAYLVPSIRHAVAEDETVVVSTATIALQRQLVDRDLPRLAKALKKDLGRELKFAILKGRRNYLCMHRVHNGVPDEPEDAGLFDPFAVSKLGREVKRLHEWSSDTETGDRDELVPGVSEQSWRQVVGDGAGVSRRVEVPDRGGLLRRTGEGRGGQGRRGGHEPRDARHRRVGGLPGAARPRRGGDRRGA